MGAKRTRSAYADVEDVVFLHWRRSLVVTDRGTHNAGPAVQGLTIAFGPLDLTRVRRPSSCASIGNPNEF